MIPEQPIFNTWTGDGTTTVFNHVGRIYLAADLWVYTYNPATDTLPVKMTSGYTVAIANDFSGATVTITPAPAAGVKVGTIRRMDLTQDVNISNTDYVPPSVVEQQIDRQVMMNQEAVRFATVGLTADPFEWTTAARAGKAPVFDNAGSITYTDGTWPLQGAWSAATTYAMRDVVTRDGAAYISRIANNLNIDPALDSGTNWMQLTDNGSIILNGSGAPSAGIGTDGDYYIDNSVHQMYGPKASGVWPAPVNLIGPAIGGLLTTRGDLAVQGAVNAQRLGLGPQFSFLGSNGVDPLWRAANDARADLDAPVYAVDRATLKALDTTKDTVAVLLEAGRQGIFKWTAGNFSTQITADTQEGIYLKANAIASTAGAWVRVFSGLANIQWFGAALNDVTDDTAVFNAAFAVYPDIFFPQGRAYVTDMISVPNGGNLVGVGVGRSVFSVKATFNMAASAVVRLGTAESMTFIDKIGFEFAQPTDGIRANLVQYPFAVLANVPRVRIGHIRISRGWNGVNAVGNCGGSTYDWIECGVFNIGLWLDGALDTVNLGRFRVWPFGMTGGQSTVYSDGTVIGFQLGRCDGLDGNVQMFRAKMEVLAVTGSASRHLNSLHLDGDHARLRVLEGPLDLDFLYSTKDSSENLQSILLDGNGSQNVCISDIYLQSAGIGQPSILVNCGSLSINGGVINHTSLADAALVVQKAYTNPSSLSVRNTTLKAPGARTGTYISGGPNTELNVQNCPFSNDGGTGTAISTSATTSGTISGNKYYGRAVGTGGSPTLSCDAWQPITPTISALSGTITTVGALACKYRIDGTTCFYDYSVTITTNGTGATALRATLPVAVKSLSHSAGGIDAGTGAGAMLNTTHQTAVQAVDVTKYDGTYPGSDGAVLRFSGCYDIGV